MLTIAPSALQMAQVMDRNPHRMPLSEGPAKDDPLAPRTVPILTPTIQMSGPPENDPMEITTPTNSSAPPSTTKSPDRDRDTNGAQDSMRSSSNNSNNNTNNTTTTNNNRPDGQPSANSMAMAAPPPAAAPAVGGPKIVQTAFIHKLYK